MPTLYIIAGLSLLAFLLIAAVWRTFGVLPSRTTFEGRTFKAWLDPEAGELRIMKSREGGVTAVPYGRLEIATTAESRVDVREVYTPERLGKIVTTTVNGKTEGFLTAGTPAYTSNVMSETRTGRTQVTLSVLDVPEHFHKLWSKERIDTTPKEVWSAAMPNSEAAALKRWFSRHRRTLVPDLVALRKAWDSSCQQWLQACHRQRSLRRKPVVEGHGFFSHGIHYVCVEEDGSIHAARGNAPLLVNVTQATKWAAGKLTVYPARPEEMHFDLDDSDIRALQKLVRNGKLSFN